MNKALKSYLSEIGRKGGRKSRRELTAKQAREMVAVREARKAYKKYYAQCFWSYDPNLVVGKDRLEWVADKLRRNGDRTAWMIAARLCP